MSAVTRNRTTYLMLLVLTPAAYCTGYAEAKSTGDPDDSPKELSVAPLDHVVYPDDRPEWVNQSLEFDREAARIVVVSGPSDSREESVEELKVMQRAAVSTYIAALTESAGQFDFYSISDDEIDEELVVRRYSGLVTQGDATRYEDAVEIVFTEAKREEIQAAWNNLEVRDRLGALGVIVVGGLGTLIASSGLLGLLCRRVDRRQKAQAVAA